MNIIQKQAADFYSGNGDSLYGYHKPFVDDVKNTLSDYRKISHKIEFIDTILNKLKEEYDEHIIICDAPETCSTNSFYENSLFFLQEEVEDLESQLPPNEFNRTQKAEAIITINALATDINALRIGQQVTYEDLMQEFKDLRNFLYLDKANFTQLILGKITDMAAGGVVSETLSKSLLELVKEHYSSLLSFKF